MDVLVKSVEKVEDSKIVVESDAEAVTMARRGFVGLKRVRSLGNEPDDHLGRSPAAPERSLPWTDRLAGSRRLYGTEHGGVRFA